MVTTRIRDSITSTPRINVARMFNHVRFTQGPRTSRSLHRSNRNRLALGSSTPASACTDVVIKPNGAPGTSATPAASTTRAVKLA